MDGENGGPGTGIARGAEGRPDAAATLHDRVLAQAEERKRRAQPADPGTYTLALIVAALLFKVFVGPRVLGRRNVPKTGPLLVVANHLTYLEPPLVAAIVPRRITYLARYELFDIAWLAPVIRLLGVLPVKRGGERDLDAIRAAVHLLQHGEAVGIFPEGTRSITPGLLRANPGVSLLAARTGAPILPVAVTGTEQLESLGRFLFARPRGARVRVVIGKPFHLPLRDGKVDHQALADQIMLEVAKLLPPAYRGEYAAAVDDTKIAD